MATGFGPLCDDDVRTNIHRVVRVIEGMHLANQRHAGLLYALGIWPWIREGQHHGALMPFERDIEQSRIFRDGPCNETGSDIRSRYLRRFRLEPEAVDITSAQQTKTTS